MCHLPLVALAGAAQSPPPSVVKPETTVGEGGTCFFHPENAAVVACGDCGRFVCALCEIELDGRKYCPACFEQGQTGETIAAVRQRDFLYDSLALAVGWWWLLFYFTWILALPGVLYLAIAQWSAPKRYLVPRSRWRYPVALLGLILPPALFVLAIMIAVRVRR